MLRWLYAGYQTASYSAANPVSRVHFRVAQGIQGRMCRLWRTLRERRRLDLRVQRLLTIRHYLDRVINCGPRRPVIPHKFSNAERRNELRVMLFR